MCGNDTLEYSYISFSVMKSLIYETQLLEYITILYDSFHHSRSFKIFTKQTQIFNNFLQDYHMQQRRGKIRKSKRIRQFVPKIESVQKVE